MCTFAGIDLGVQPVPDETTICRFRHLLEQHGLGRKLFKQKHQYLQRHGFKLGTGTTSTPPLSALPTRPRTKDQQRDPDMHQTKLIHSEVATAANVHDSHFLPDLLHGRGNPRLG